ncbi:MAG: hypothetical protein N3F07_01240 [Candidatus Micrarchaeota archaeon]|nr:hypothetical protein [Candidatus Micrarchaeota archaeon]
MLLFQLAEKRQEEKAQSSRKSAQKAVLGWYSDLRSRVLNFLSKLF